MFLFLVGPGHGISVFFFFFFNFLLICFQPIFFLAALLTNLYFLTTPKKGLQISHWNRSTDSYARGRVSETISFFFLRLTLHNGSKNIRSYIISACGQAFSSSLTLFVSFHSWPAVDNYNLGQNCCKKLTLYRKLIPMPL